MCHLEVTVQHSNSTYHISSDRTFTGVNWSWSSVSGACCGTFLTLGMGFRDKLVNTQISMSCTSPLSLHFSFIWYITHFLLAVYFKGSYTEPLQYNTVISTILLCYKNKLWFNFIFLKKLCNSCNVLNMSWMCVLVKTKTTWGY